MVVLDHYQPYSSRVWLWGQCYPTKPEYELQTTFYAIRDAEYFVHSPETLTRGFLSIDDMTVTTPVFRLKKGNRVIRYQGDVREFYILWLPRNGKTYVPKPERATSL